MSATELLFLRHAESEGNVGGRFGGHSDTPLSARGRQQAHAVAAALAREHASPDRRLAAIWASDLPRAQETAAAVVATTSAPLTTTAGLRERSVGELTGLTFAEAQARFPDVYAALMLRRATTRPPGGETLAECAARALAVVDDILARHAGERVLVVSHGITLALLLGEILGVGYSPALVLRSDNAALHRLKHDVIDGKPRWTVFALNDRAHL